MSKITINLSTSNIEDLLSKMEDLSKIGDTLKMKIDNENLLIYSIMGEGSSILAFKSYLLKTNNYMDDFDQEDVINIIIPNAKRLIRSLSLLKESKSIKMEISYKLDDDVVVARFFTIKGGRLKISSPCGEISEIRDITKEFLTTKLEPSNRKWNFEISKEDFLDIKKLSNINSDGKILNINVTKGKVILSETSSWEIEIDDSDLDDKHLIINKSYLSNINDFDGSVSFNVFEHFLLIMDENSHLMFSFEQTFND